MAGNFQVSSKLNDGRIFVVASETYAGFCEALEQAVGIEESQSVLQQMAQSIVGTPVSPLAQASATIAAAFPGSTVDHTAHPLAGGANTAPASRTCSHGAMTKREGAGAKGPWKAFMCPSPKGTPDQCEPVWIKRGSPEWSNF